MICRSCDESSAPYVELDASLKPISRCQKCHSLWKADASPAEVTPALVAVEPERPRRPSAQAAAAPVEHDILGLARERLAVVCASLADLERLQAEKLRLERMIAAAESIERN